MLTELALGALLASALPAQPACSEPATIALGKPRRHDLLHERRRYEAPRAKPLVRGVDGANGRPSSASDCGRGGLPSRAESESAAEDTEPERRALQQLSSHFNGWRFREVPRERVPQRRQLPPDGRIAVREPARGSTYMRLSGCRGASYHSSNRSPAAGWLRSPARRPGAELRRRRPSSPQGGPAPTPRLLFALYFLLSLWMATVRRPRDAECSTLAQARKHCRNPNIH